MFQSNNEDDKIFKEKECFEILKTLPLSNEQNIWLRYIVSKVKVSHVSDIMFKNKSLPKDSKVLFLNEYKKTEKVIHNYLEDKHKRRKHKSRLYIKKIDEATN